LGEDGVVNTERNDRQAVARPRVARPRGGQLADVFGDVLPDTTNDEREPDQGAKDQDAWYHENRPPHHDPH
jgi:hypothetical protein